MKRTALHVILAVSAACAILLGPDAASLHAQDGPGIISVVGGAQEAENGKECCAYLGIYMDDLTTRMKEKASYPHAKGVLITSVYPGGPAEKAGIEGGDICYSFDGVKVEDPAQIAKLVKERKAGDKVAVVIFRKGKEKKLFVTLERREPEPSVKDALGAYTIVDMDEMLKDAYRSAGRVYVKSMMKGHLGMVLLDLNDDIAPYFNVKSSAGALVYTVEKGSPAEKAGIKGGDVIASVNGGAVETVECVTSELADIEKGDKVTLEILRKGVKKSYVLEADETYASAGVFIAPFDQGTIKVKKAPAPPDWIEAEKSKEEAQKLKEAMKALKERLKELEERLGDVEKRE
jgi:membrane-associated protease RseP (regulator of RpoE activity)